MITDVKYTRNGEYVFTIKTHTSPRVSFDERDYPRYAQSRRRGWEEAWTEDLDLYNEVKISDEEIVNKCMKRLRKDPGNDVFWVDIM